MATFNCNTSNDSFRQTMGNGVTYAVPPFQRDYSWTEENWDELWQDILALFSDAPEEGHYMGYLVLQTLDNRQFKIIDGQQRLTTLSVMLLAALKHLNNLTQQGFDAENNLKRVEHIRNTYIGYMNPVSLVAIPKLTLNRTNDPFYRNYLVTLADHIPLRNLNASESLLRKAFFWFLEKISQRFRATPTSGREIAAFLDALVDKLFFTVIKVTDELNAFKVFETLNARGVRLSSTDLLKNWFFALVSATDPHESEVRTLEDLWAHIIGQLGGEAFPEFLRIFWNSRHKLVRKTNLFKTIRNNITSSNEVFPQLREIDYSAGVYDALRDPQDKNFWNQQEQDCLLALKLFGVRQPLALLLAAFEKLYETNRDDFYGILRQVTVVSLRYNVICNQPPNEQEALYNRIATGIMSGKLMNRGDVKKELLAVYPPDEIFRESFASKVLHTANARNKHIVRYLLAHIEQQEYHTAIDIADSSLSIEHILPESPDESWGHVEDHRQADLCYRLGNMTLLESSLNRDLGNANFAAKQRVYKQSAYRSTKALADLDVPWDENTIIYRQRKLAKIACTVWRND